MNFHYQDEILFCEGTSLAKIAAQYQTPIYIYSQAQLDNQIARYQAAAAAQAGSVEIAYAVKANGNVHLLRHMGAAGLGADVTSGGELFLAQRAGIPSSRIFYAGVGKTEREIYEGVAAGIGAFHVESAQEFERIAAQAAAAGQAAGIGIRVNPDIAAATHRHISTGSAAHKFGVAPREAIRLLRRAAGHTWLRPRGLTVHIGSQIHDVRALRQAAELLVALAAELAGGGVRLEYLDVGGGLAVDYSGATAPDPRPYLDAVAPPVVAAGYQLQIEPGRSLIAPAGILLTRVLYTKHLGKNTFLITDAGMGDLIRPVLYDAEHPIWPVRPRSGAEELVDIVGPICESGDFLARDRALPPVESGDLLAIMQAGAYGHAMSSNYNGRGRPAELLIDGTRVMTIRPAETYHDLL